MDQGYRFGAYHAQPALRQLRREGRTVRLPPKAFALLEALLERPGEVVTRDELRGRLWPATHVDYERGLNNAVNRLRIALRDSARRPRFVETVGGRGYRFLAPVEIVAERSAVARPWRGPLGRGVAAAAALAVLMVAWLRHPDPPAEPVAPQVQRAPWGPAYAAYWAGLHHQRRQAPGSLTRAWNRFKDALARDPALAPAHAGLALVTLERVAREPTSREQLAPVARTAAARALALDGALAEAHVAAARVRAELDRDWAAAERQLRVAIALSPASAATAWAHAELLAATGRLPEALKEMERACLLDPSWAAAHARAGRLRYLARDLEAAAERLRLALDMQPELADGHIWLSDVYRQQGLRHEAEHELRAWLTTLGVGAPELARVRRALEAGGMERLWRENLRRVESAPDSGRSVAFKVATFYAGLGRADATVAWLSRALELADPRLLQLGLEPGFDRVRDAPGFQVLLARIDRVFRRAPRRAPPLLWPAPALAIS